MKCSRCLKAILKGERWADDPCCGAPDCEGLTDRSHYACLPRRLQEMEDEDNWIYDSYDGEVNGNWPSVR